MPPVRERRFPEIGQSVDLYAGSRITGGHQTAGRSAPRAKSDRLEPFDDERFGQALAGPFLERRQRHHRIEIMPRVALHLESHRCGSDAPPARTSRPRHRRRRTGTALAFHSADGNRPRSPGSAPHWPAHRPTASLRRPGDAGSCRIRCAARMKPECISAEIERACARRARSSGHSRLCGNFSARYSMIDSESHTVTSPSTSAGTLPAR